MDDGEEEIKCVDDENNDDEGEDDEKDEDMNEDEEKNGLSEFKQKVVDILEDSNLISKRSAKMEITDFLLLLSVFNKGGIHFK